MKMRKFAPKYFPWAVRVFLAISLLVMALVAVTIAALSGLLKSEIVEMERESLQKQVEQLSGMVDQLCLVQLQKTDPLLADEDFLILLSETAESVGERYQLRSELGQRLNQAEAQTGLVYQGYTAASFDQVNCYLSVLTDNLDLLPSSYSGTSLNRVQLLEQEKQSSWYHALAEGSQTFAWGEVQSIYSSQYLTGYRKITNISNFGMLGVLKISIPLSDIRSVLRENGDSRCQISYLDSNGACIFTIGEGQACAGQGDREFSCQAVSPLTGNTLQFLFPERVLLQSFQRFYTAFLLVMVLILAGCLPLVFLVSRRLSSRIRGLAHKTRQLENGDFSVISQPVRGNDEIAGLERRFNSMVLRLKEMLENEIHFKEQIEEMKVELLQEQINPHLLYNTLAMIRFQAKRAGLADLGELSNSLIIFYRRFLNEGDFISTIGSELAMIHQYIQVVQKVYSLDLTVEYDLPPEIEGLFAVKLFLQPVVENAILHGIRPMGKGTLRISAVEKEGGEVLFEISDNGCGIEREDLAALRQALKGERSREEMRSVGLFNVNQRIRLLYGAQYGLRIDSVPGDGTTVTVTLPLMGEEEKEQFIQRHGLDL